MYFVLYSTKYIIFIVQKNMSKWDLDNWYGMDATHLKKKLSWYIHW